MGNLCSSADSARCLLEEIPTPDTILAGHRTSVELVSDPLIDLAGNLAHVVLLQMVSIHQ